MAQGYKRKSPAELAWDDNARHIRARVNESMATIKAGLLNKTLADASEQFQAALDDGEILRLGPTSAELTAIIAEQAADLAALEAGSDADKK